MSKLRVDLKLATDIVLAIGGAVSAYYMVHLLMNQEGPAAKSSETKKKADASLKRLKVLNPDLKLDLNDYENAVLASVVTPFEIDVKFDGEYITIHLPLCFRDKTNKFLQILEVYKTLLMNYRKVFFIH
ncbi:hypothetical protein BN7_3132 [Wickerhamomyces ciferrii]|uniref:Uncharacterized protein n=1 Tax=Wickerhamomyces ciferrii (strain ATCC 14091 / BCRC 22168 / CBS 111 / JCM 3599 / NBRC 0793 / NRRL Y-1031 F-60-10) TaxID=1206466 RepID=K0KQ86_WICCF|nr:uncharacterized protein BN7_3132 [Wickerhamomyces ciferrii]CCH43579.1 hypothetical protein BN7_3132 [Wickerhamomyces ciferrii]